MQHVKHDINRSFKLGDFFFVFLETPNEFSRHLRACRLWGEVRTNENTYINRCRFIASPWLALNFNSHKIFTTLSR